ncbi:MAG: hypothetical protein MHM6MM_002325 [Cercozoa sp. M6MM]
MRDLGRKGLELAHSLFLDSLRRLSPEVRLSAPGREEVRALCKQVELNESHLLGVASVHNDVLQRQFEFALRRTELLLSRDGLEEQVFQKVLLHGTQRTHVPVIAALGFDARFSSPVHASEPSHCHVAEAVHLTDSARLARHFCALDHEAGEDMWQTRKKSLLSRSDDVRTCVVATGVVGATLHVDSKEFDENTPPLLKPPVREETGRRYDVVCDTHSSRATRYYYFDGACLLPTHLLFFSDSSSDSPSSTESELQSSE